MTNAGLVLWPDVAGERVQCVSPGQQYLDKHTLDAVSHSVNIFHLIGQNKYSLIDMLIQYF